MKAVLILSHLSNKGEEAVYEHTEPEGGHRDDPLDLSTYVLVEKVFFANDSDATHYTTSSYSIA